MPNNPLEGLKRATGISAGPLDNLGPLSIAGMPILPGAILAPLRGLLGRGTGKLASEASHRLAPVVETLGERNPMFTPLGGEGLYNVARQGLKKAADPLGAIYQKIMSGMGR